MLADKPFTPTLAEAERVAADARRAGAHVVVAHHHRFHPMIVAGAGALRGGRVGLPWNVQVDFVVAGGNPCPDELLNFGCYPVDAVAALTGLPVHRVHATGAGELTVLALDHEHGLTSTIVVGRTAPRAGTEAGRLAHHRYRVSGSHGVLVLDATKPSVTVTTAARPGPAVAADRHASRACSTTCTRPSAAAGRRRPVSTRRCAPPGCWTPRAGPSPRACRWQRTENTE